MIHRSWHTAETLTFTMVYSSIFTVMARFPALECAARANRVQGDGCDRHNSAGGVGRRRRICFRYLAVSHTGALYPGLSLARSANMAAFLLDVHLRPDNRGGNLPTRPLHIIDRVAGAAGRNRY